MFGLRLYNEEGDAMNKNELVEIIASKIERSRESIIEQWNNPLGTKTRHFIIEDLLPDAICDKIYDAFPKNGRGFFTRESFREKKRTSAHLDEYDSIIGAITYAFQDIKIINSIASLVGMKKIVPDPKLYAGGLSMMFKNDFLNPHIDNSHDADRKMYRRLNLLYYPSPNWCKENGGNFELWNDDRTQPKTIIAGSNRLVVMETNRSSWHSVSPVRVDEPRCCVSNYYFSETSPDAENYFHVTSFSGRPNEKLKRAFGIVDNSIRNTLSKVLKIGRGKEQINNLRIE